MYIKRHMEAAILEASASYPVVMVTGARQVGKSTMLFHIKEPERRYVTLDDSSARHLALHDPALFFEVYQPPLLLDEFQRAPGILLELKRIIDDKALRGENCAGLYWLTGSQKFVMMEAVSESLAGRVAVCELTGLSTRELDSVQSTPFGASLPFLQQRLQQATHRNIHQLYERILQGSMPRLWTEAAPKRDQYYMDYVNTYLERDIRELSQVGKLKEFFDFLVFMAARTGQELRYQEAATAIGVSAPTVKSWVSMLEQTGIIYILQPYFSNLSKRLTKTPKFYFLDTGLAAWLCHWPTAETLEAGPMSGTFFETYVITEIIKSFRNSRQRPDIYFYRDAEKKELDLLLIEGNKMFPIEIKKGKTPSNPAKNFSALQKFSAQMEIQPGLIICLADELLPYNRDVWYCPVEAI